jgi:hypothetical protein
MNVPSEIVSKIMLFHSNLPFQKEELVNFVHKWSLLKYLIQPDFPSQEDFNIMNQLIENKMIRKFYIRSFILSSGKSNG